MLAAFTDVLLLAGAQGPDGSLGGFAADSNGSAAIDWVGFSLRCVIAAVIGGGAFLAWLHWPGARPERTQSLSPWAALWVERFDPALHVVAVDVGRATYFGRLGRVDPTGASKDLLLLEVYELDRRRELATPAADRLLIRRAEVRQILLIERTPPRRHGGTPSEGSGHARRDDPARAGREDEAALMNPEVVKHVEDVLLGRVPARQ